MPVDTCSARKGHVITCFHLIKVSVWRKGLFFFFHNEPSPDLSNFDQKWKLVLHRITSFSKSSLSPFKRPTHWTCPPTPIRPLPGRHGRVLVLHVTPSAWTSNAPPPPLDARLFIFICHHMETAVAPSSQYSAARSHHFSLSPSRRNAQIETGYPTEDWRRVERRKIRSRRKDEEFEDSPNSICLIMHLLKGQGARALASLFLSLSHTWATLNLSIC